MLEELKKDARERMAKCVATFQADLKKLRTGRAHPSLVEHLKVDYYGSDVPLQQVASIAVEDGRTLVESSAIMLYLAGHLLVHLLTGRVA